MKKITLFVSLLIVFGVGAGAGAGTDVGAGSRAGNSSQGHERRPIQATSPYQQCNKIYFKNSDLANLKVSNANASTRINVKTNSDAHTDVREINLNRSKFGSSYKEFNPDPSTLKILSERGVFRVEDINTHEKYIIRFQVFNTKGNVAADIDFEVFANQMAEQMQASVQNLSVEKLGAELAQKMLALVRNKFPELRMNLTDKLQVSITKYVDARSVGIFYLQEYNLFRQTIIGLNLEARLDSDLINDFEYISFTKKMLIKYYQDLPVATKHETVTDLKELISEFKNKSDREITDMIFQDPRVLMLHDLSPLVSMSLKRMPLDLKKRLAEMFMIFQILGIPDSHSSNILWDGRRATAIDLSFPNHSFFEGSKSIINEELAMSPLPFAEVSPNSIKYMFSLLTPQFIDRLKSLDEVKIVQIARQSGYNVNRKMVQGILARAQAVINQQINFSGSDKDNPDHFYSISYPKEN